MFILLRISHLTLVVIVLKLLLIVYKCSAYQSSWGLGYSNHHKVIPQDVMVDVVNNLGLKLLAIHNDNNDNNIAISPYGALSVLIALAEGTQREAAREIQHATRIPTDLALIRIGLRDIHRHLKSYFIPEEGFLAGLTLSHDNVTLRREYEDILKFYGYDINSFNVDLYPEIYSTTQSSVPTTPSVLETTITTEVPSEKGNGIDEMTTQIQSTTGTGESVVTTTTAYPTSEIDKLTSTFKSTTVFSESKRSTLFQSDEVENVTTLALETSSMSTEFLQITETVSTTESPITTIESIVTTDGLLTASTSEKVASSSDAVTALSGEVTSSSEETTSSKGFTSSSGVTSSPEGVATASDRITSSSEAVTVISTQSPTESNTDTLDVLTISQNPATNITEVTTVSNAPDISTITEQMTTQEQTTSEETTTKAEVESTTESLVEVFEVVANSTLAPVGFGARIKKIASTTYGPKTIIPMTFIPTLSTAPNAILDYGNESLKYNELDSENESQSVRSSENDKLMNAPAAQPKKKSASRTARSIVDYIIARYYDDHSITLRPPSHDHNHQDLSFLINGKFKESGINFMTYDTVLPYHFVPHLNAMALKFPLDSSRYYLLLLLPINDNGVDKLICDLRLSTNLRYIIRNLRYTHVKAIIPSFMLKGYVTLTSTFQKLGIRKVFEPRQADFSPMTDDKNIYVTNIEQAITVTIRNYMDPKITNDYRYLHQYDPVTFKADHPFLYFVIDSEIHVTLMEGKIVNPLNSRIG